MTEDVRYAYRTLTRQPRFSLTIAFALALAIAANTVVFSLVDRVLLQPLGYDEPDRLVSIYAKTQESDRLPPSYPDFEDWRRQSRSFEGMAAVRGEPLLLRRSTGAERVTAAFVSRDFFSLLGGHSVLGRTFVAEEESIGGPRVAVLSYGLWQRLFGGDTAVVGQTLDFDRGSLTVVGVMSPEFDYPTWSELWTPLAPLETNHPALTKRDFRVDNRVVARLAPGVRMDRANAELEGISRQLGAAYPVEDEGWGAAAIPLEEEIVGDVGPALLLLLAAVGLVLLIACADIANLLLVRASIRQQEINVRVALGASRWRVVRQLLAESLLLAGAGGVLGLLLSFPGLDALKNLAPGNLPRLDEVSIDARVLAFSAVLTVTTALVFGLAPALHAAAGSAAGGLREGERGGTPGSGGVRLRSASVVVQIALALMLLVGAGLLLRSFVELRSSSPGFETERLLTLRLEPSSTRYATPEALSSLYDRVRDAALSLPGVESAGIVSHLPTSQSGVATPVVVAGQTHQEGTTDEMAWYRLVDEWHFTTLRQVVLRGRGFRPSDMTSSSRAVVVNESLARDYWGDADPLGRSITVFKQSFGAPDYGQPVNGQVVGVVRDVTTGQLWQPAEHEVYLPLTVEPWRSAYLSVRTLGDPASVVPALRRAVRDVEQDLPVAGLTTVEDLIGTSLAQQRFSMQLLVAFAAVALLLAAMGIYAVAAFVVAQRTREIGIRTALGARPRDLLVMFLSRGLGLTSAGLVTGLGGAFLATRLLTSFVYGVRVTDLGTFALVTLLMGGIGLVASYLPARRAARLDPSRALRYG